MSSPADGHTFRFFFDIRGSAKVVGDEEYSDDADFAGIFHTFEVRGWSLREALKKAAEMPFPELMNPAGEVIVNEASQES